MIAPKSGSRPPPRTSIDDFLSVTKTYGRVVAWALAGAIAPILAGFANLAPPWPENVVQLTALVELLALVLAFQLLRRAPRRTVNRVLICGAILAFVTMTVYLVCLSQFVFEEPLSKLRFVKGFICTREAMIVFPGHCPQYSDDDLRQNEWEAGRFWTLASITIVRVGLDCLWFLVFFSLAATLGSFITYQSWVKSALD
jgi:hypothetical protein